MKILGANQMPHALGVEKLRQTTNYFLGRDPLKWKTKVSNYARVKYEEVYPGIDLVFYGKGHDLEYDFIVHQGARRPNIRLSVSGIGQTGTAQVEANGDLEVRTAAGELTLHRPVVYQRGRGGEQHLIESHYTLPSRAERSVTADQEVDVSIEVGDYDRSQVLIIDPILTFSTYLGGSSPDVGKAIAVDSAGNAYIAGGTDSTDFPTAGPIQGSLHGSNGDAFVTKINAAGSAILYSTYLGGSFVQQANGIAVDSAGNAYVAGLTSSSDFPVTQGAFDTNCSACGPNVGGVTFISKLDTTGSQLLYSTYLGGTPAGVSGDTIDAIAVDSAGSAYVTGESSLRDFPTTPGAFQQSRIGGLQQVFVTKLNAGGSALSYSTYLGAGAGTSIAVNTSGSAYVAGVATSATFPTTPGAFQTTFGGPGGSAGDAFVTQLNAAGSGLVYSTFLGGNQDDYAGGIGIDAAGNAYVAGQTFSANFPVLNAFQPALQGVANAYVAKLNPSGNGLIYSTYLGGSVDDLADAIAVDSAGNAYVTGFAQSTDFPLAGPLQGKYGGGSTNAFLTVFDANGSPSFSTFLGGNGTDQGNGIAVDSSGDAYLTGITQSTDFPAYNALQATIAQGTAMCSPAPCSDAFITKFALSTVTPSPDFVLTPSPTTVSVTAGGSANYRITLTPIGGFSQAVSLSCSGQPPASSCMVSPISVTSNGLNSSATGVLVITTAAVSGALRPAGPSNETLNRSPSGTFLLGFCTMLVFANFIRRAPWRAVWTGLVTIVLLVIFILACGGSGGSHGGSTGTSPGQYTFTVTGNSGNLTHSVKLTLNVN